MHFKIYHKQIIFTFLLFGLLFLNSCKQKEKTIIKKTSFEVVDFNPFLNWESLNTSFVNTQKSYALFLDYGFAIDSGFTIPSKNQVNDGKFQFQFKIKNHSSKNQKFWYKIYYQNESYKFPEHDPNSKMLQHEFAHENFYGSWKNTDIGFKETSPIQQNKDLVISDQFEIAGNPRNEKRYFYNSENDRWKRNPRVGDYSFLLVVVSDSIYQSKLIPKAIEYIHKQEENQFINPYHYFLFGNGTNLKDVIVYKSEHVLNLSAKPNLGSGIFVNKGRYLTEKLDTSQFRCNCNKNNYTYNYAPFEEFIHYVDASTKFNNIPEIADVLKNEYTKKNYFYNKSFYKPEELIATIPKTTPTPCESVFSDSANSKIILKNLKSTFGNWRKQNVGVISRHGFTFGKYTVKAKLTELLNEDNMWNGLTNAIWMINQGGRGQGWNNRRSCTDVGYMATYWGGRNDKRAEQISYSEIDFEILKTVPYCPDYIFPPIYNEEKANRKNIYDWFVPLPSDVMEYDNKIVVATTNWDMACPQPKNYDAGCQPIIYKDTTMEAHRWEDGYRALTEKSLEVDDEIFGSDYFYFQIEWKPTEIIWRIGPEIDKLRVVGYMNDEVTSIPNNQMLMIITQEFHNTKWWIGSQYDQGLIPFPKNDIIGEIYEFTIE
jgi:hypothetical protein